MYVVEVIPAQPPVDTEYLIGEIEVKMFDERGGVFHSYKHGVTVIVPAGAIPTGILAELKFAATLVSPVSFSSNKLPMSAIFWLCMDVELQKKIQIRLPLMALKNSTQALQFAKGSHSKVGNIDKMKIYEDDVKFTESYGSVQVDHFCYYCIVDDKLNPNDITHNHYILVAMKQCQPNSEGIWEVHICLVSYLRTCLVVSNLI